MACVEWSTDLETGIAVIDRDHRILVDLINQLHDSIGDQEERATLGSVLNSLYEYTGYHFAREEKLQELVGYPGLEEHRARHRQLVGEVGDIRRRYAADPDTVRGKDVHDFLQTWLVEHILRADMHYVDACKAAPEALKAVEAITFGTPDPMAEAAAPKAEPKPIDWASLRILVVEDNRNFQVIIQTVLKSFGVRDLTIASSGDEGLEVLAAKPIDLILCDWRMEGMDGLAFVQAARQRGSTVGIIMMSGYGDAEVRDQALLAGVSEFLEKPITARGFLAAANKVLNAA